jgi:acetoin utilization deacetylase AcuC-like enzyme
MYVIYDDFYLKHYNGPQHPENANRLIAIKEALDRWKFKSRITIERPRIATDKEIEMVHDKDYIQKIKNLSRSGGISYLDLDTAVTEYTYDCALLAAGGCFKGLDLVFNSKNKCGRFFAVIRPPGHHAFRSTGSGFCIFNNAALSARYTQARYGIKRIAIIDFDAHHGNGTQDFFYDDSNVFYISFHQYPHYPGTGNYNEIGSGKGRGFNMNFPFMPQTGDPDYLTAMIDIIIPIMERFSPELFLVSAGYDSHFLDALSSLGLVEESYYKIMYIISYLSHKHCYDRIGILLEGGYEYNATARSVLETIRGCFNKEDFPDINEGTDLEDKLKIDKNFKTQRIKNAMVLNRIKEIFKV